jgi:signal transduction histidine kinase
VNDIHQQIVERRKAISEAFHSFHQPLTSLHCGLELALSKPRTEGEYRKRIEDALVSAGQVLRLNKALRELVDATDPGERFGTVALDPMIAQLREEAGMVAGAAGVTLDFNGSYNAQVAGDPMKLLLMLGNLVSGLISRTTAAGRVTVQGDIQGSLIEVRIITDAMMAVFPDPSDMEHKLREIRVDAARSYFATIGGTCSALENGYQCTIPTRS